MDTSARTPSETRPGAALAAAVVAVAVVSLVLLASGCGGDQRRGEAETVTVTSGATGTQTQPTTTPASGQVKVPATSVSDPARRAYIARIDGICRRFDPEQAGAREKVDKSASENEAVTAYDDSITLWSRQLSEIETVSPPTGDRAALEANLFGPIRRQLALRRQISGALANVDVPSLERLRGELDKISLALTAFARGYGFRVCGEE